MTKPNYTTWIDGISYSAKTKVLTVVIRGTIYLYQNVSRRQRDNFRYSFARLGMSWGEAYNRMIKGRYACIKLA